MKQIGNSILIAALVPALCICLGACGKSEPQIDEQPRPASSETPATQAAPEPAGLSDSFFKFVEIRRTKPIDPAALTSIYGSDLAAYVKKTDADYGKAIDTDITDALQAAVRGEDVHGNVQTAEKLVQYAFLLNFRNSLGDLADSDQREALTARIQQAAPVVRAAAARRSTWIGKQDLLPTTFDSILDKALQSQAADLPTVLQEMDSMLAKVYVLSVFYELGGLAESRGVDPDKAAEKTAEAKIYYLCIMDEHKKRNAEGAATVADQLSKPPEEIDVDLVRQILKIDFAAQVSDVDQKLLGG